MLKTASVWGALALTCVSVLCIALLFLIPVMKPAPKPPGSVIKLMVGSVGSDESHGSGVHIGEGYILSAAHVVGDAKEVKYRADDGSDGSAEVVWTAKQYDLAMLHIAGQLLSFPISCRKLSIGDSVHAVGNPGNLAFMTTWGKIGSVVSPKDTPWKETIVYDGSALPGMSGGALLDDSDHLVGILVGSMGAKLMGLPGGSIVPIGFVVPASAFCGMIGR